MTKDIRDAIEGARETLLADAVGVVALVVILFVGLSLPALV